MTTTRPAVVVLGSANADLVVPVHRIPKPGETLMSRGDASRTAGGKGLNQAVASARDGARTCFIGAVGKDDDGELLRATLVGAEVDVRSLRMVQSATGLAVILVATDGENSIVVVPGANATLTKLCDADRAAIASARVLLGQLETPVETFIEAAHVARAADTLAMLNAAPSQPLPDSLWPMLDLLVVNEHEAADLPRVADGLLKRVPAALTTLGSAGSRYATRLDAPIEVAATPAQPVDTTGAGDTFCGVLAAALAAGLSMRQAMQRAGAAASLAVERTGAVPSIPYRADTDGRLARHEDG